MKDSQTNGELRNAMGIRLLKTSYPNQKDYNGDHFDWKLGQKVKIRVNLFAHWNKCILEKRIWIFLCYIKNIFFKVKKKMAYPKKKEQFVPSLT